MKQRSMSDSIIVLSLLLLSSHLFSFNVRSNWLFANKMESPYEYGFDVIKTTNDNSGNTYCAGIYRDQLFLGGVSLQCQGSENLFLAKMNGGGTWQWARSFWGTESYGSRPWERVEQIQCVGDEIYVLGYTYFPITIDGITIEANEDNSGSHPLGPFIAKFNTSGICTMGIALNPTYAPNNHYVFFKQMTITNSAIFIAGSWQSPTEPLQFGEITVSGYNDGDNTDYDIIYAKIDLQGDLQWVKAIGGPSDEEIISMCSDNSGNIYVGGDFQATMFAGSTQLVSSGFKDVFVISCDSNGNVLWSNKCGSTRDDKLTAMQVRDGVVFVTGNYTLQCSFGALTLDPVNNATYLPCNIFIASISNSGSWGSVNRICSVMSPGAVVSGVVIDDVNVYILIPGVRANSYSPLQFGNDDSWYPLDVPIEHSCHVIAGLNKNSNHWFGIAYTEVVNDQYNTSLTSYNQYLYIGTPVSDNISFGNINITATMGSCYALAKISKSEVVVNDDEINLVPSKLRMELYPNPVTLNSMLNIEFQTKTISSSVLEIFNIKGQKVRSFNNLNGLSSIIWNGLDESSKICPSGVYFCVFTSGKTSLTKKVALVK